MNYDNIKNIEMTIELLKKHGISNIIISPGGTNIPLVKKIQDDTFFNCYSIVDERSAVYFAIGIFLQTGEKIALTCTSAQATRNYIPGLTEAFYKNVPILAITMEKHPRFKYQDYMQAPDQTSLPRDCVKKSYELPFIKDINDIYHTRRMINEAILELDHNGYGPVQLCIPWLDFPIDEIEPTSQIIRRYDLDEIQNIELGARKVLLIIGEHRRFADDEVEAIDNFCKKTNTVVFCNHLSNFNNDYTVNGDLLLLTINDNDFEKILPDVIISIGGQTGDYPFYNKFSKTKYCSIEYWRVSENGNVIDTYDKLTKVFQCKEKNFFKNINNNYENNDYYDTWATYMSKLNYNIELPFSNLSIAQFLHNKIPYNSIIQFSILNTLRVWNFFKLDKSIECYSNVGAFGIDGGMSTLIGQSIVSNKKSFMIIGDLAFYYDMNSLGIRHIKNNLRIMIINNNGGMEFKYGLEDKRKMDKFIAAANHFKNAEGWSKTCGFIYLRATNVKEFISLYESFIGDSDKPIVFEVFVADKDESEAYHKFIESNKEKTISSIIKKKIKTIINK